MTDFVQEGPMLMSFWRRARMFEDGAHTVCLMVIVMALRNLPTELNPIQTRFCTESEAQLFPKRHPSCLFWQQMTKPPWINKCPA